MLFLRESVSNLLLDGMVSGTQNKRLKKETFSFEFQVQCEFFCLFSCRFIDKQNKERKKNKVHIRLLIFA